MKKIVLAGFVFAAVLSSNTLAQVVANDSVNGLELMDLGTGQTSVIAPPEGVQVAHVLGYDAGTGLLWFQGYRTENGQTGYYSYDLSNGAFTLASQPQEYFERFEAVFIPSNTIPNWAESMVSDQAHAAAALAGVLDIAAPGDGQDNFLNFSADRVGSSDAVGVSYARNVGNWRFGAAYGRNDRGEDAGKVSAGFGW